MIQLLRKCPPGFGGVERVAHELATALTRQGDSILTFYLIGRSSSGDASDGYDPLPVNYSRFVVPSLRAGKLLFVLPSLSLWKIINSSDPLLLHLPCPVVLLVGFVARLVNHKRKICVYWHAFLQSPDALLNFAYKAYEWFAYKGLAIGNFGIISTSPVLAACLDLKLRSPGVTFVLPCCLSQDEENLCLSLRQHNLDTNRNRCLDKQGLKVAFVGRSCTYKRVDLLIRAFGRSSANELYLIGHGDWVKHGILASSVVPVNKKVFILGCLDEDSKLRILARCDLHILPSFSSNEAFGIAQLEAMACGLAACSPQIAESGMCWVNGTDLIFDDSDVIASITNAIDKLNDSSIRNSIKEACHQRYLQMFARKVWLYQLLSIREALLLMQLVLSFAPLVMVAII